jgi:hypothetical protein
VAAAYAEAETERLAGLVPQLTDRHEVLIADTAGFGNRSTVICIGAADGVLVPATPGEGDIVEAQKMVTFVQATGRTIRRDIQARVLANRIRRGTTLSRHLLSQIEARACPARYHAVGGGCLWRDGFSAGPAGHRLRRRSRPWSPNYWRWNGCRRSRLAPICSTVLREAVLQWQSR